MQTIRFITEKIISLIVVSGAIAMLSTAVGAAPKDVTCSSVNCSTGSQTIASTVAKFVEPLLWIAGAIAVIFIIAGGIRYAMSNGDQSSISAAKNTILYAVIGLIIILTAYAIVAFVVSLGK